MSGLNVLTDCLACGIWIVKSKSHRPQHKWEKDSQRGAQERRRRTDKEKKNNRARSEAQVNPTSEAYLTTDPIGPGDRPSSPPPQDVNRPGRENTAASRAPSAREGGQPRANSPTPRAPSRQSSKRSGGSSNSPIDLTGDLGSTKRLLFPSPRKDGVPKALGELAVNVVQTAPDSGQSLKEAIAGGKENSGAGAANSGHDDMEELFGTPPKQTAERPCTPPPGGEQKAPPRTPFKTPTRATPSHRPITRSVSKSIRSSLRSPGGSLSAAAMAAIQRTPTKTPRSARAGGGMTSARRRGAHVQGMHAHFDRDVFDSPFTATLNQLLSEANDFTADSASHGLVDLDLSSVALPPLPGADDGSHDGVSNHLSNSAAVDFQAFLSTDAVMPSSPPVLRKTAAASGARGTGASAAGTTDATSAGKNGVDLGQLMLDSFNDGDAHMWTDLDHAAKH